ncbi:divalent-cation tolerance protein CutA [Microplitis mediator]|uniref:divalent-cation tolerance protein CutA n=1 Tax=Microplitis mediator TaxID=375433 RepID=UPI0025579198|nr:divalent-cation tolerance protein CutA [Microplitis mediator]
MKSLSLTLPLTLSLLLFKNINLSVGQRAMNTLAGIYSVAYVTVPDDQVAKKLAHGIVKNKLAACVNIIPQITSVYEWKNEINEDQELLLMIKTRTETIGNLTDFVKKNHPYEVCEVISLPINDGNEQYLNWIGDIVPSSSSSKK